MILSDAVPSDNTFYRLNNVKQVLNLGSAEYTTTSYGLDADEIGTQIDAQNYMAPISITEEPKSGAIYTVLATVPLFVIAGIIVMSMTWIKKD